MDDLAVSFGDVHAELGDERIGERELGEREAGDGELRQTEHADAELRDADDAAAELADRDDAARHHRRSIGPELERDVQQRQSGDGEGGLVFVAPTVPARPPRKRRAAMRTGQGLFRDRVAALAAGFHGDGAAFNGTGRCGISSTSFVMASSCALDGVLSRRAREGMQSGHRRPDRVGVDRPGLTVQYASARTMWAASGGSTLLTLT